MRRVITGIDNSGKSIFARDDESPHKMSVGSFEMGELWGSNGQPQICDGGGDPAEGQLGAVPAPGNTLVRYVVLPPEKELLALAENNANSLEASEDFHTEDEEFGMHTTDSVDYGFILQGQVYLELDDGQEKLLKAGDSYVQNGTRHAWHNRSDSICVLGVVMIGASRT